MESVRIADICSQVYSGGTPTSTNSSYYDGGIPWLNTNEVNFCNIYKTNRTISEEGLKHSAAKFVPVNTIIVAMYGVTAGRSAIAKIPLTTNQACCNLVIDSKKANYQYVYYFLKQQAAHLNSLANGGAQQNLNSLLIKKYSISLPSLKEQDKIASILSVYEDLIEKNNRKIAILREMAEELYKEWFVRRKSNQWPIVKMRELGYQTESGKRPKGGIDDSLIEGVPSLGAEVIDKLGTFDFSDVKLVPEDFYQSMKKGIGKDKDILLYKDGAYIGKITLFMDNFPYEKYTVNEHVFLIRANNKLYQYYLYFTLNQQQYFTQMQNLNRNAAQPGLTPSDIDIVKLCKPDEEIIKKFNRVIEPMLHSIFTIAKQNNILKTQRDLLLPRLMSGKLEVRA